MTGFRVRLLTFLLFTSLSYVEHIIHHRIIVALSTTTRSAKASKDNDELKISWKLNVIFFAFTPISSSKHSAVCLFYCVRDRKTFIIAIILSSGRWHRKNVEILCPFFLYFRHFVWNSKHTKNIFRAKRGKWLECEESMSPKENWTSENFQHFPHFSSSRFFFRFSPLCPHSTCIF